ncbi:MAG: APC family permease [Xanthobacteraceae bacterium]
MANLAPTPLKRRLNLPLLVLYGTGVTVGAGIYVLIGAVAEHAGAHAPWAFVIAAIVMGLTVSSYAELCTRYPVSAAEAAYVKAAFNSRVLSTFTGILMIVTGTISSATVSLGAAGYIRQFIDLPVPVIVVAVVAMLALIAAWGILESVVIAGFFTLIEVGGLIAIIVAAARADVPVAKTLLTLPSPDFTTLSGIAFASLLAFFAFIGFEDLVNMVEETKAPGVTLPRAMAITLVVTTLLYVAIAAISVATVPLDRLAASPAPLSLVFRELAQVSPATISAIAIVATLNTILAELTMASRVVYGMSRQGDLPRVLGKVHAATGTPLIATGIVAVLIVVLAFTVPFERLAEASSVATLTVFALVNLSLLRLRLGGATRSPEQFSVPLWIPAAGLVTCIAMMASALFG